MTQRDGQQYIGTPHQAKGKKTMISMSGAPRDVGGVTQVRVVGRQNLTNTEKAREKLIHCLLTGTKTLRESAFIRLIWFPLWKKLSFKATRIALDQDYADEIASKMKLNDSQRRVVVAMTSENALPLVVTHGTLIPNSLTNRCVFMKGICRTPRDRQNNYDCCRISNMGSVSLPRVDSCPF